MFNPLMIGDFIMKYRYYEVSVNKNEKLRVNLSPKNVESMGDGIYCVRMKTYGYSVFIDTNKMKAKVVWNSGITTGWRKKVTLISNY